MLKSDEAAWQMGASDLKTDRLIYPGYFASIGDKPHQTYKHAKKETNGYAEVDVTGHQGAERVTESTRTGHRSLVAGRPLRPGSGGEAGGIRREGSGGQDFPRDNTRKGRQDLGNLSGALADFREALALATAEDEAQKAKRGPIEILKAFWSSWKPPRNPRGSQDGGKFRAMAAVPVVDAQMPRTPS